MTNYRVSVNVYVQREEVAAQQNVDVEAPDARLAALLACTEAIRPLAVQLGQNPKDLLVVVLQRMLREVEEA